MINITEKKLRAAIQIILGSEGMHTGKLEEDLVYGIKALSICEVIRQSEQLCQYKTCNEKHYMYGYCKHHLAQQDL